MDVAPRGERTQTFLKTARGRRKPQPFPGRRPRSPRVCRGLTRRIIMNRPQRLVAASAGLAGMFLIGSLTYHPGSQAKGAYSTPVTLMNATANPGSVLENDTATRIPYQSNQIISTCSGLQNCAFPAFTAVPTGYRLYVTNVSGFFNLQMNSTPISGYLENFHLPNQNFWGLNAPIGGTGFNGESFAGLNQNVNAVFDAGEFPFVVIYGNFLNGFPQAVNVTGYLLNCTAVYGPSGCPAVQH